MNISSEIEIRRMGDADVPKVPDFFEGLSEESRHFYHPYDFNQDAVSLTAKEIQDDGCIHIGAFHEEKMVGHVWCRGGGKGAYPYLGIGIVDSFHDRSLGTSLMQRIEEVARERGEQGIELTCYPENHRALRVYAKQKYRLVGKNSSGTNFRMVREFADDDSPFPIRGVYASSIPWSIAPLTTDTWHIEDWKWYIELLNAAGCNLLKLYIWPTQYYHPDETELAHNAWRYQVWREALAYARVMGMETHVGFSVGTVPPTTWLCHPELRAEDPYYTGITLCWQRGKERILPYQEYLIDTFAEAVDSFVLWFADPGACICSECRDYLRVILDSFHVLSDKIGQRAKLTACPWWIQRIEAGELGFAPHPNLRKRLAEEIPDGSAVIVQASEYETIDIMRENGLIPLPLAFFLDPESGLESNNILPEPKLKQIDEWLEKGLEENHTASLAYRLTPYTQYPGDYYFFRRQLKPGESREAILAKLGEFICNPCRREEDAVYSSQFASAVESLDEWWHERNTADIDDAVASLSSLAGSHNSADHVFNAATILRKLADGPGELSLEDFTEEVRLQMSSMPIFRGLTLDYLWSRRALAFLQLRVQNWLARLQ